MFKFGKEHVLYVAAMGALFVALDFIGVSHGDKMALAVLIGALMPLYAPRFAARLTSAS